MSPMEESLRNNVAELQDLPPDEGRSRRAAAVAAPIQATIAAAALAQLRFDDSPYDYAALLVGKR